MSRKSGTLSPVAYAVDDASEYLTSLRFKWHSDTDARDGDMILVDVGHDYRLSDAVEAIKRKSEELGVRLHFGTNRHLESFAASEDWNRTSGVVAFGSFVVHPDFGSQVAVLKGGKYTSIELVTRAILWPKHIRVLCVTG